MRVFRPLPREFTVEPTLNDILAHLLEAPFVDTGHWQAKKGVPMTKTRELHDVVMEMPIAASPGAWSSYMRPNLPWAEEHFLERVSGIPHNPPPSHVRWPFNQKANAEHMDGQVFSHSYPERLWPTRAGDIAEKQRREGFEPSPVDVNVGIRYRYGDLDDLVTLLIREPYTRQAYAPLWFPEDLAASVENQRVPCTLGYHFILRNDRLHCFYPMRSLDVLRYFQDDAYMAGRLCQWVIEQCRSRRTDDDNSVWHDVLPGNLTMHVVSMHCFEGDLPTIRHRLKKEEKHAVS